MKKTRKETKSEVVKVEFDKVNEVVLIAAVISDEKARAKYLNLPVEYFFGPGHPEMWAAIKELYKRELDYSPDAIQAIAGNKFDVSVLDGYVKEYSSAPANLKYHVNNLRWDKTRHEVSKGVLPLFIDAIRDPNADPDRVRSLARQLSESFSGASDLQFLRDSKRVVSEHSEELTRRRLGHAIYPIGIPGLDFYGEGDPEPGEARIMPGLAPKMITALVGISGHGKTVFTANMMFAQVKHKKKVLWGAWEQSSERSLELAAVISLGFSRKDFQRGRYSEEEQKLLEAEMERLGEYIKFFELPFGRAKGERFEYMNDKNLDLVHQYVAESGCSLFVADVFKYALRELRPDDEAMAIKRLKAIATDTSSHIIAVHHVNLKEVEGRVDKRPTRDAVMGSSGWINDVDNAFAVHCPGIFGTVPNNTMEVHILKQKYGPWPLAVECDWDPVYGRIENGRTLDLNGTGGGHDQPVNDFFSDPEPKYTNGKRNWRKSGGKK